MGIRTAILDKGPAALLFVIATIGAVDAQRTSGPAWSVRSLESRSDHQESRPDILDTPILPGSVMKAVTLVAALEAHVIDPHTARTCRRVVTVDGRRYTCSHPDLKRPLTAAEALAHSCNDFFVSLAPRLSRTAVNDVRARLGLPPLPAHANFGAALVGLDGPRITPRVLLDVFTRLAGADTDRPLAIAESTRRVLTDGFRGAARYGSASELSSRGVSALAKTGTAPMPGGGSVGVLLAAVPADRPRRVLVVVAPGAAGRDAVSIAADLLSTAAERIRVGVSDAGDTTRIDTLTVEDYVARGLAGEGQPRAAPAAEEALAIAVRTFALANRSRHGTDGYDMCDTTHCQVLRPATAQTRRAALATAGRVLTHDGKPAAIFYSAWCGGRTELASAVWPGATDEASGPSQEDAACRTEPAWASDLSASEIERALRFAGLSGDRLRDLRVARRNGSGRVARLRADGFAPAEISGQDFRMAVGRTIGWERLKSTSFEMQRSSRGYAFRGRGSGHGVGMCVLGAGHRAAGGATAEEILRFYYPGLRIDTDKADILVTLPGAEENERAVLRQLVRASRDEIAARAGMTEPPVIRVTVHPNVESFGRATGQPWWVAGATSGAAIDLLPVSVMRRQGQLERTVRHEVAHALLDGALSQRAMWVREGAALYFADRAPDGTPGIRITCPTDAELLTPASRRVQRDAYLRAERCFRRQLAEGKSWRDVR